LSERIDLKDIRFAYSKESVPALDAINLSIRKGQSIGIVGPSGGGKSTLIVIILGLLVPDSGRVSVDDADIMTDISGWRGRIGFVPQQIYLLDDTMRRNIAFGLQDTEIDDAKIAEAVRLAYLKDVVAGLHDGLDTVIGEQGTRLSGGQRQRVAIARALYRDPDILVFDEATSALDTVSESEITRAIETLSGDRTVLFIAHRLSTIKNCDVIAFIEDGKIVDQGGFDELCARNAKFANLATVGAGPSADVGT
jgi:ATP-binding cassette subfamily C protein